MGGSGRLRQIIFGFKLTGTFSQKHTFPTSDKLRGKRPLDLRRIARSNDRRFRGRASKAGFKNADQLWRAAEELRRKGWLSSPIPLATPHQPFTLVGPDLNIAVRFGVEQADKLRACDDIRYSVVNLSCVAETPIKLSSLGHVAEMCRSVETSGRDWHFAKADHGAAYKQIPLDEGNSNLAVVDLRSPTNGRWYGFVIITLLFGAVAAVIHYNVFSRIISELMCRTFGTPMIGYFEDFGSMLPAGIPKKGVRTFTRRCRLLGVGLKLKKSEVGVRIAFLGLMGSLPNARNGMKLIVSLTEEKASRWSESAR